MSAQPRGPLTPAAAKAALRADALARRRARSGEQLLAVEDRLSTAALGAPVIAAATQVAAYVSTGTEPGTRTLLNALTAGGAAVIVPVLREDADLDWVAWSATGDLRPGPRGTLAPDGPRLGPGALAIAQVILVPGLGVDRAGNRLGRGGGSYDRALRRADPGALVAVVLYEGEIVDRVPAAAHDVGVHAALTPAGLVRLAERVP
ncbi:MAG: 5-formyltetrahydrofolate cyclo-ligase [Sporichthyaceae bacterium]